MGASIRLLFAVGLSLAGTACGGEAAEGSRGSDGPLELVGAYRRGDPIALAVADGRDRLWSVDGATLAEWELAKQTGTPSELAARAVREWPLDVTVMSLVHADGRLFVAGGAFGLWSMDLAHRDPTPRRLERRAGLVCTDVAVSDGLVLATFAAARGSELLVLDGASLKPVGEAHLPGGPAWALDARDGQAWVALGAAGLARVDLADPTSPRVEPGPGAEAFPTPAGSSYGPNLVRDVSVSSTHVHAAADGAGLAVLSRGEPWSPEMPFELVPLELDGAPTYAARVSAEGDRVAVGTNLAPVRAQEGAPFGLCGWMDARLDVGGVGDGAFARGSGEGLLSFRREGDALRLESSVVERGGWRTLALLQGRTHEQHIGLGWVVRDEPDSSNEGGIVAFHRPSGYVAMDGALSLLDPGLVLFGTDPAGSRTAGWLGREAPGSIGVRDESQGPLPLGLRVGAQWVDAASGEEWCLAGEGLGWSLVRVDAVEPAASEAWPLVPPTGPDGARPLAYFSSTIDGDLLLLAQARTQWGLLGLSASELTARARACAPGTKLALEPAFQARTHDAGLERWLFTWAPALFRAPDGRHIAVVPAGFTQGAAGAPGPARTLLFDVSAALSGSAPLVGEFEAPRPVGHALAAQVTRHGERTYAFVVDFAHGLDVLDVSDPEAPELVGGWSSPVHPFDLERSNVLDLELERTGEGLDVYLAAGRLGLVRLDASDPRRFELPVREVVDTPGWAVGLCLRRVDGERVLLVGDQRAGLREYR